MRKLKLYIAASLDGKIARKDDSIDWLPDPNAGEDYGYEAFLAEIDTLVMGYKTYEICLKLGEWPYEGKKTYVFTRDLTKPHIPQVELINQNPVDFTKDLLQQSGKDIWLVGGGEINTLLHDAGLIDSYIIAFIPLILGEGIELLPQVQQQQNLKLTKHQVYDNGVVLLYLEKP
ncbi:dihydrofolate reductase family protein [Adhaeribacter radiodurans]|uniref:Dihydrofolate reductase n=1 Tax=Adhaeribacter radiodurans TaxID=2745197 RepID=A0A7L7L723_9BACT|nr:dihydrofolate reductase family protein [Adhaeribacter radiodurans]QMU28597.1 dihydrofolate reductase [Adhaeribacter radiodurans]